MTKIIKKMVCVVIISFSIYLGFAGYRQYDYNQGYARALIRTIRSFDDEGLYKLLDKRKNMDSTPFKLFFLINDSDNANPLQEAASLGNYSAVVALVEAGADVNFINPTTQFTPLLDALWSYNPTRITIANYLVDHGADVHYSITKQGVGNALAESISYYGVSMVESYDFFLRMISLDSNPYIYVSPGNIFLKSAFDKHKLVMVYLLENEMFDVNTVNEEGFSALMFLARFTITEINIEMVNILLEHGADKTLVNEDGMTAYDYASETGNAELINLLRYE